MDEEGIAAIHPAKSAGISKAAATMDPKAAAREGPVSSTLRPPARAVGPEPRRKVIHGRASEKPRRSSSPPSPDAAASTATE